VVIWNRKQGEHEAMMMLIFACLFMAGIGLLLGAG
jgi:hypothetical protein